GRPQDRGRHVRREGQEARRRPGRAQADLTEPAMNNKGILVVALTQRGKLLPASYELLTAGRALADAAKEPLMAVVLGGQTADAAKDLIERGADKVFAVQN